VLIAFILWAVLRPRPKAGPKVEPTFLDEEALRVRQYNAQQWIARNQQIIRKESAPRPCIRALSVPETPTPKTSPKVIDPPAKSDWPFPSTDDSLRGRPCTVTLSDGRKVNTTQGTPP
jgi:hypothetical protein